MEKFEKRFYGDKARWKKALKQITDVSKEKGDERDLRFLESLLKNEPFPDYTIDEKLAVDTKLSKLKVENKNLLAKYKALSDKYAELYEAHETLLSFNEAREITPIPIIESNPDQAIAFIQWSDWHVGEYVSEGVTNGLNKYNPEICERRVNTLVQNTIKLIKKEQAHSDIECLVVHLGGDFINGWIHEENKETNTMTPIEEVLFATELLEKSFRTLLDNIDLPIKVVCNYGNHGRYTKFYRFGNEKQTSLETLLYSNIVRSFKDEMEIRIPESTVFNMVFFNQTVRFCHGHQIKYRDGVGGLTIPMNKKQHKWDDTDYANFNFMCHYHTCSMPNSKTVLNGSLVGYNGLAMFAGFAYEPPQQSFILYHKKYGWTAFHKILAQ